jgi:hypothetical protein
MARVHAWAFISRAKQIFGKNLSGRRVPKELGKHADQSSQWQKLGAVPDDEFEAALALYERSTERILNLNPVVAAPSAARGF